MNEIRAFVGHSFTTDDEDVVRRFLGYFEQIAKLHPSFSWEHARAAEPAALHEKVLSLLEGKNTFIAICTCKERVIANAELTSTMLGHDTLKARADKFAWKTSDWLIQEIGLAVGRNMKLIILLEQGCKRPGGLQGDIEYIQFDRDHPNETFGRILEMLTALSPPISQNGGASGGPKTSDTKIEPSEAISPEDDLVPTVDWDVARYKRAAFLCLIREDDIRFAEIENKYLSTPHGQRRENAAEWEAKAEWHKTIFQTGGSLEKLRRLAVEFPNNTEILSDLAISLGQFDLNIEAAEIFNRASELASDDTSAVSFLGQSAIQFATAGEYADARAQLEKQKLRAGTEIMLGTKVLKTIQRLADVKKDDALEVEVLERTAELAPDNYEFRFQLAYKHSQLGNDELALYHYLKIPAPRRTAIGWNNLGACYQHFQICGRSVEAYRRAAEEGETLAMSNLSYKFMNAGFLAEAKAVAIKAMAIDDHHINVEAGLSALTEMDGKEQTAVEEVLTKCKRKAYFYSCLGRALSEPDITSLTATWQGPACRLTATIKGNLFTAVGSYDRPTNALVGALSGIGSLQVREYIEYRGEVIGKRIEGTVKRWDDSNVDRSLLLGNQDTNFLMIATESKIEVMEGPTSSSPSFYELVPV